MDNAGFLFLQEEESRIYSHNCFWDTWHLMVKVRQVLASMVDPSCSESIINWNTACSPLATQTVSDD